MKADVARVTFDPSKMFRRVLLQQGRVLLDSDWNEQIAILLHYLQSLAADLIGPFGGPGDSFKVSKAVDAEGVTVAATVSLGPGHYYVDGILCENSSQRAQPLAVPTNRTIPYLVYLDVWERLITAAEDESVREVALGGADTAARAQTVWQVRFWDLTDAAIAGASCANVDTQAWWHALVDAQQPPHRGLLKAKAQEAPGTESTSPCIIPPLARFRGEENQLYRVEVHRGGHASATATDTSGATFKWSRDNGSVVFPIHSFGGNDVTVTSLGRDARETLEPGDWVEYVYDDYVLNNRADPLFEVMSVDPIDALVTLDRAAAPVDPSQHPLLRRWDQKATSRQPLRDGAVAIRESSASDTGWMYLEDGVQIQFQPQPGGASPHQYRTGDYWLIPARVATGDVEWPGPPGDPQELPPRGDHHYAPLARVTIDVAGTVSVFDDYRRILNQIWHCAPGA